MSSNQSTSVSIAEAIFRSLAKLYIKIKKPIVVAVAGSVGKTSTKLFIAKLLETEKYISYMDDSYNSGIGLYLSIFRQKIPTKLNSVPAWIAPFFKSISQFFKKNPEIIVIEYGIDHIGDMDTFIKFLVPDIAVLTAVCPEHMEFLKTIDIVGEEETRILFAAKKFGIVNNIDVDAKYTKDIETKIYTYGDKKSNARYSIKEWTKNGAIASFNIDGMTINNIKIKIISEPLIRQLAGAMLLAKLMGISEESISASAQRIEPAASRMKLFEAVNDATVIDDTTNFSPLAGIEALKALKRIPAKRRIAVLGNMHELGEYADQGFADVAVYFEKDIDILVLVGELSAEKFGPFAKDYGFIKDKNLYFFNDSVSAGIFLRDELVKRDDVVLVKGPFGGYYLEEVVKKLLKNSTDSKKLTRQSDFWINKKQEHFGKSFNQ